MKRSIAVTILIVVVAAGSAVAQSFSPNPGSSVSSALVCLLAGGAGCAMGGEIRSDSTHDVVIHSSSSHEIALEPSNQVVGLRDFNGNDMGTLAIGNANYEIAIYGALNTTSGGIRIGQNGVVIGMRGDATATDYKACFGENLDNGGMGTTKFCVSGTGVGKFVPESALTIANPTDTTSQPTASGSACRMSAAGAAAWTPSETNAVDGAYVCCTNTGAFAITMTSSSGVYEGPGTAIAQWRTVCMDYVTDRWVERSHT